MPDFATDNVPLAPPPPMSAVAVPATVIMETAEPVSPPPPPVVRVGVPDKTSPIDSDDADALATPPDVLNTGDNEPAERAPARLERPVIYKPEMMESPDAIARAPRVKAEFVWADGARDKVSLVGAWNDWIPIKMFMEGGSGMWSVVTEVPAGTYEYRFLVDDEWRYSSRHPTVGEPPHLNNVRFFQGPTQDVVEQRRVVEEAQNYAAKKRGCCSIS